MTANYPQQMSMKDITEAVVEFYLSSHDFNGIPISELARRIEKSRTALSKDLRELLIAKKVTILGLHDDNPHILRHGIPDIETQTSSLDTLREDQVCVYPCVALLRDRVPDSLYSDEPYRRALALGAPQLSFRSFDLAVLEHYRNDPRYIYHNTDVSGHISIAEQNTDSGEMADSDQILLDTFGFAYDERMNRAVAVFLRYLARLSPQHQQIWKAREIDGEFSIHPDYHDLAIQGSWNVNVSICDAILAEIRVINEMSRAMGRERLFRKEYGPGGHSKPRDFSLLIRPTRREFQNFIMLLDKILSDNLNQKFFRDDVNIETEEEDDQGRVVIRRKGTLMLLDEWLRQSYSVDDWTLWEESYAALTEVRKLRQRPAHALDDDVFDQEFIRKQREILERVYSALRILRSAWQTHPDVIASKVQVPAWLEERQIVSR